MRLIDIDMHADFMRLRGKTYDYRIGYNQIQKLFLLPKPDDTHCQFVVRILHSFLEPIRD